MTAEPRSTGPGTTGQGSSPQNASRGVRRDAAAGAAKGKGSDPAADVAAARAELAATLDALQDKLNVPKRVRIAAEENPIGLGAVALGVVAAIAGAVWLAIWMSRRT
ncbi:DUF3618 domain-containing protein [Planctomonas sp. JC2975]|uniref:DUF3618 domain-containing protein n=1 Tax=Planctomonas sp. JC2975 TaxID=2729626 RepID=UPI0014749E65|nr:DUF3618 domain-containing protein [Planctomonas sp. JC2975]NNC12677.1 DUF3618 domain-containing protein [Planctomonas sp. JC2975]